jgi:glutamate dehydrogenase (NAD(P)+)
LLGFPNGEPVTNAEMLETVCDVLVLAAEPRQITASNALRVRAPLIVEGVEGAITRAAAHMLENRGGVVIPALLAGAGATAAAYLEWSLNVGYEGFLLDSVEENIRLRVEAAYADVRQCAQCHNVSLCQGALLCAVDRVAGALRMR